MRLDFFSQLLAKILKPLAKILKWPGQGRRGGKQDKLIVLVLLLAAVFFFSVSSFIYLGQRPIIFHRQPIEFVKWLSPDETANYIFAKLYGQTGRLTIFERYNLPAGDIIHPRSFLSVSGVLKPMSFLGIIIYYGFFAALTSYKLIPYFTPALAGLALVYFYLLVKKIFSRPVALVAVFLLASFPPFVYYSARSMFHNVGFVVWLIIGFYYLSRWSRTGLAGYFTSALAGLFFGLALSFRTSEVMWLGPVLALLAALNWRRLSLPQVSLFLAALVLPLMPVFYWNQVLYGAFWRGGYPQMNQSISQLSTASLSLAQAVARAKIGALRPLLAKIKSLIFYFGFKPAKAHLMLKFYGFKMFPWLFYPAGLGLVFLLAGKKKPTAGQKKYLVAVSAAAIFLLYYYGSWEFYDNPDHYQATIGNSYTRYWLPLYLGFLPLAAYALAGLSRFFAGRFWPALAAALVAVIMAVSLHFVLFGSAEGLVPSLAKLRASRYEFKQVLEQTEANAVIITRYHDKLFFPERKVVVGLFDDLKMVSLYRQIARYLPLYYYNFSLPPAAIDYLNRRRLAEAGLKISLVKQITPQFSLYQIKLTGKNKEVERKIFRVK